MHFACYNNNIDIITLRDFKECKTLYKYTKYGVGKYLKKHPDLRILEADDEHSARQKFIKLHEEMFSENCQIYEEKLKKTLERYIDDIDAMYGISIPSSPVYPRSFVWLFKDFTNSKSIQVLENPDDEGSKIWHIEEYGGVTSDTYEKTFKKIYKKVLQELGFPDFVLDIKIRGSKFSIIQPSKNDISLGGSRNHLEIKSPMYHNKVLSLHIMDHYQYQFGYNTYITMENFAKLGVSYKALLNNANLDTLLNNSNFILAAKSYDDYHTHDTFESSIGLLSVNEDERTVFVNTDCWKAEKAFQNTVKNCSIHIYFPSLELHLTEESLYKFFKISKSDNKILPNSNVSSSFSLTFFNGTIYNPETNKCFVREIRRQLSPGVWKAFLLLNEVSFDYDNDD